MDERVLLEAEESRLLALLSSVRTNLNSLLPIATLPNEVLESIFAICVSWLYSHRRSKYRLAWTQVCRKWRQISLNSASLWRCIDLCDSRLAHEFLVRSGTAPISIISASPFKLCTDNLQPHAARLHSIDVFLFPDDMKDLFASLGPDLSSLTSLSLKIPPVSGNFHLRNLGQDSLSQLGKLTLDGVSIPWGPSYNLTYLCLRGLGAGHCPSISEIHALIDSSPAIKHLRFENLCPPSYDNDLPPVHLAELQTLILSNKAIVAHSLLSLLTFPLATNVQITCPSLTSLPEVLPLPFPWHTNCPDIPTIRLGRNTLHLIQDDSSPPQPWAESLPSLLFTFALSSPVTSPPPPNSLPGSNLLPALVLPHLPTLLPTLSTKLTSLELGMGVLSEIPPPLLADFFSHTPQIERILVAFNDKLDDLILALTPNASSSLKTPILCPHLESLSFGSPTSGYIWYNFPALWFPQLALLTEARHAAGAPLALLEFWACQGLGETVAKEAFKIGDGDGDGWVGEVRVTEPDRAHRETRGSTRSNSCVTRREIFLF